MSTLFDPNFPGLQVNWTDQGFTENEFIDIDPQKTGQQYTSAESLEDGKHYVYRYPVGRDDKGNQITLTYRKVPPEWAGHPDWGFFKGQLVISLDSHRVPKVLVWNNEENEERRNLKEGRDWTFQKASAAQSKITTRGKIRVERYERREQALLRKQLLARYGACMISGCDEETCLDACHIVPVANGGDDTLQNVILLRADLHRLFDACLLDIVGDGGGFHLDVFSSRIRKYLEGTGIKDLSLKAKTWMLHKCRLQDRMNLEPSGHESRMVANPTIKIAARKRSAPSPS